MKGNKIMPIICMFAAMAMTTSGCNAPKTVQPLPKNKTYSILFIGNSYTYFNNMPITYFKTFAQDLDYDIEVDAITSGGYTLEQFSDVENNYGKQVNDALTGSKKYDFVILQEQSVRPASENAPAFYTAVRNLVKRIRTSGAKPILYSTWGRKQGNSTLDEYNWTNEIMTWRLAAAYQAIGDELNVPVAHVGLAFFDVYNNHGEIDLYDADLTHPSFKGSYLAGLTLFAKVFQCDPMSVEFMGRMSQNEVDVLRKSAKSAVFSTPAIRADFKTSSKGIGE